MNSKEIYKMYKQIDQMINQLYNNGYANVCTPGKNFKEFYAEEFLQQKFEFNEERSGQWTAFG